VILLALAMLVTFEIVAAILTSSRTPVAVESWHEPLVNVGDIVNLDGVTALVRRSRINGDASRAHARDWESPR